MEQGEHTNDKIRDRNLVRLNVSVNASYVPREDMDYTGYVEFIEQGLKFNYKLRLGATLPKLTEIWREPPDKFWDMLCFDVRNGDDHPLEVDNLTKRVLWMSIGQCVAGIGYSPERFTEEGYRSQKALELPLNAIGASLSQGIRREGFGIRRDKPSLTGNFELDEFLKRYESD